MKKFVSILLIISLLFSMIFVSTGTANANALNFSVFLDFEGSLQGFTGFSSKVTFTNETTAPLNALGSAKMSIAGLGNNSYLSGDGTDYINIPDGTGYDGICFKLKSNLPANCRLVYEILSATDENVQNMFLGKYNTFTDKTGNIVSTDTFDNTINRYHVIMPTGEFDGYIFLPFNGAVASTPPVIPYDLKNLTLKFDVLQNTSKGWGNWNSTDTYFDDFSFYKGTDYASLTTDMNKMHVCKVLSVESPENATIDTDTITAEVPRSTTSITVDVASSPTSTWKLYSDADCTTEIADNVMPLDFGLNTTYVKVSAANNISTLIYSLNVTRPYSTACDVVGSTVPADITINGNIITATSMLPSIIVDVVASEYATWKLYHDVNCVKEAQDKVMNLAMGENTKYIKVLAQDGKKYKKYTLTVTRIISTSCDIVSVTTPTEATIGTDTITSSMSATSITVNVTPSINATWKLYSDLACITELTDNIMPINAGTNTSYIKVTAEDEITTKVYTLTVTKVGAKVLTFFDFEKNTDMILQPTGLKIDKSLWGAYPALTFDLTENAEGTVADGKYDANSSLLYGSALDINEEVAITVKNAAQIPSAGWFRVTLSTLNINTIDQSISISETNRISALLTVPQSGKIAVNCGVNTTQVAEAEASITEGIRVSIKKDITNSRWVVKVNQTITNYIPFSVVPEITFPKNYGYLSISSSDGIEQGARYQTTISKLEASYVGIKLYDDDDRFPASEMGVFWDDKTPLIGNGSLNISPYTEFLSQTYSTTNFFKIPDALGYDGICFRLKTDVVYAFHKYTFIYQYGDDDAVLPRLGSKVYYFDRNGHQIGDGITLNKIWLGSFVPNTDWQGNPATSFDGYIFLPFDGAFDPLDKTKLLNCAFAITLISVPPDVGFGDWEGSTTLIDNFSYYKGTNYPAVIEAIDPTATPLDVLESKIPTGAKIGVNTISASVPATYKSLTVDVTSRENTTWKLYSDTNCTTEITDNVMPLNSNSNIAYIKVTSLQDETFKIYTVTITKIAASLNDIVGVTTPADATIGVDKVTATVSPTTRNITVDVTVTEGATWKLYSDSTCETEIANNYMKLAVGANKAYIMVTAQGGVSSKRYTLTITRAEPPILPRDDTPLIDEDKNISVTDFSGSTIPTQGFLKVEIIDSNSTYENAVKGFGKNANILNLFRLTIVDKYDYSIDDVSGLVVFRFPVPAGYNEENLSVILFNPDGSAEELSYFIVDGQLEVYSLVFGEMAIVNLSHSASPDTSDSFSPLVYLFLCIISLFIVLFSIKYKFQKSIK